ncbi:hypothetical protein BDV12DRAFT_162092 [Aspergillus spectabilis]
MDLSCQPVSFIVIAFSPPPTSSAGKLATGASAVYEKVGGEWVNEAYGLPGVGDSQEAKLHGHELGFQQALFKVKDEKVKGDPLD